MSSGSPTAPAGDPQLAAALAALTTTLHAATGDQALTGPGNALASDHAAMLLALTDMRSASKDLAAIKTSDSCGSISSKLTVLQARAADATRDATATSASLATLQAAVQTASGLLTTIQSQLAAAQKLASGGARTPTSATVLSTAATQLQALQAQVAGQQAAAKQAASDLDLAHFSTDQLPREGSRVLDQCEARAAAAQRRAEAEQRRAAAVSR